MSKIIIESGATVNAADFWVNNGAESTQERFEGQNARSGSLVLGIGNATAKYSEYVFQRGDMTFRYVGEWETEINGGILGATTSAHGSYNRVVIEKDGEVQATLILDNARSVDFGSHTGIDLLGLGLDDLTNPLIALLIGDAAEGSVDNIHLDATPTLPRTAAEADITVLGDASSETLRGTSAAEVIDARAGNDVVYADGGSDTVLGREGNDRLYGEAGNDTLIGGTGADRLDGGSGSDTASYANALSAVRVNLLDPRENSGDARGDSYVSIENIGGSRFNDTLTGNNAANRIAGGTGNDVIKGLGGNDVLSGGDGADKLFGGAGADKLLGGAGADTFVFSSSAESTLDQRDVLYGFSRADGDKINVSSIDANIDISGNQAFTFVGETSFSRSAGELRYVQKNGDTFVHADVDGNGLIDFTVKLDGLVDLKASDFLL